MFKVFYNQEEINKWQAKEDAKFIPYKHYHPYSVVLGSNNFPVFINLENPTWVENQNGRDTEYYQAFSISDLCEDEEIRKLILKELSKDKKDSE